MENENAELRMPEPVMAAMNGEKEYIPRRTDMLRDHEISIRFLSVGCIVRVGCKEIPFTTIKEGVDELNAYIQDPYSSKKKWNERFNQEQ